MAGAEPTPWQEVVAAMDSLPPAQARRGSNERRPAAAVAAGQLDTTSYLVASLGMPRWLERLQEIEGLVRETEARLGSRWRELATELAGQPERFADRWRALVGGWDFSAVNELVEQHNGYYPVERKLPFDLRRRDYVDMWGISWRRRPLDAAWALGAYPADLDVALQAG